MVSAFEERGDQAAAEVAGSSGDKNAPRVGAQGELFDFQQKPDVRD